MALSKRDAAKVGTFDFHAPKPAELFDERTIGGITIFQYTLNKAEDALKTKSSGYSVRFERKDTAKAIKAAKAIVRELNELGEGYDGPAVTCIPTGRPRGRRALVTA